MKKIFLFLFAWLLSGNLFAACINEIVFFGDSLTDNGNLYHIFKIIPRSPPYYKGRFSNGPTWAETVGEHYKDKFGIPYTIYAYGGATTLAQIPANQPANQLFFTLASEIYQFYANSIFSDKSNKLYVIWIGANDYLMDQVTDVDTLTSHVVDQISWALTSLIGQGARYFLILNLPDLGSPPYAENNKMKERLHILTDMHNAKLAKTIEGLNNDNPGLKVMSLGANEIFKDLLTHTDKYNQKYQVNLTVLNQACWQGGIVLNEASLHPPVAHYVLNSPGLKEAYLVAQMLKDGLDPCNNPEQYVFWDQLHPTVVVHQILAAITIENLDEKARGLFIS